MRENKVHLHWPSFAGKYVVAVPRLASWVARQQDPILLKLFGRYHRKFLCKSLTIFLSHSTFNLQFPLLNFVNLSFIDHLINVAS
jgi:hypothetical protein